MLIVTTIFSDLIIAAAAMSFAAAADFSRHAPPLFVFATVFAADFSHAVIIAVFAADFRLMRPLPSLPPHAAMLLPFDAAMPCHYSLFSLRFFAAHFSLTPSRRDADVFPL